MPRFRSARTLPRIAGTKKKHGHDSLHLIETARVKINKARVRMPKSISGTEYVALLENLKALDADLEALRQRVYVAAP